MIHQFEYASLSSLREMSNLLRSLPKEPALNRKLRIYIISEKEDNLLGYTQIFKNFSWKFPVHLIFILEFPEFSVEWFAFRNCSTIFGSSETFPKKSTYHLTPFQKFQNLRSNGKRPSSASDADVAHWRR